MTRIINLIGLVSALALSIPGLINADEPELVPIDRFFDLIRTDKDARKEANTYVSQNWRHAYTPILLELIRLNQNPLSKSELWKIIERKSGRRFDRNIDRAFQWLWQSEYEPHPNYGLFKARHYLRIDSDFYAYFDDHTEDALIRLDEIRWGGVKRDGIPPLKNPRMIAAAGADYLADNHIVFGIEINGDARAYPKRILAWHEMFKDTVGGLSINGVYCTLCGTVIVYKTEHEGTHYELGTSGFLYRSNKLMYDHTTESLWNTIEGEPVVGPLAGKGIRLEPLYLVTTTWGEWRKRHPSTTVLSLETGHRRDYGEGVAYNAYFSTDQLMFNTPFNDKRLKNKDEVFALRFGRPLDEPRAYSVKNLTKQKIVHDVYGGIPYVLITDKSGAIRAYESGENTFTMKRNQLTDTKGNIWNLTESALQNEKGEKLPRLPSHRAFWFGWHAAHPNTELIK